MLNTWTKEISVGLLLLSSVSAFAQGRQLEINFGGQEFRGQTTLRIKQELKRNYPNLNLDRAELERVILVAKSKQGNAQARLVVGRFDSRSEQIDGNPFDYNHNGSFNRIPFEAPNRGNGVWQIEMRGNVKVKKILVNVRMERNRRVTVTRECGFVLETIWGKDIRKFRAQATGLQGSGVQALACQKAHKQCSAFSRDIPLTQCKKL